MSNGLQNISTNISQNYIQPPLLSMSEATTSVSSGLFGTLTNLLPTMYDVAYAFINPFIIFITSVIKFISDGISDTLDFISAIGELGSEITNFIILHLILYKELNMAGLTYFSSILEIIGIGISIVILMRIYNIIGGFRIWGFKLPKI